MNQEEPILMNQKERDRLNILHEAKKRQITQKEAAAQLGVTERWVGKLLARMGKEGDGGILHRPRLAGVIQGERGPVGRESR